jgi:site-specific recombinase XerC
MRAIRRPRANSAHTRLFVRGKGDVEREIPILAATYNALEGWCACHLGEPRARRDATAMSQ